MDLQKLIEVLSTNTDVLKAQMPVEPAEGEEATPVEPDMAKVEEALNAIKEAISEAEDAENPEDPFQKVIDGYTAK
jgi:enolase